MIRKALLYALLLVACLLAVGIAETSAQQATLQGIVSDYANGQPMYGANVVLESLSDDRRLGRAADRKGFYSFGSIDPGRWKLRISFIGYVTYEDTLDFGRGENMTVNVALEPEDTVLDEVVVEQSKGAARREEGAQRITPAELTRIPGRGVDLSARPYCRLLFSVPRRACSQR